MHGTQVAVAPAVPAQDGASGFEEKVQSVWNRLWNTESRMARWLWNWREELGDLILPGSPIYRWTTSPETFRLRDGVWDWHDCC